MEQDPGDKNEITPEEREYLLEEFGKSRERWTDLQLKTTFRYSDLRQKTGDREVDLMISLSSIAIAFIAIVVPLTPERNTITAVIFFHLSLVFFFSCAAAGIVYLLWLINRDRKYLKEDEEWDSKQLKKFQEGATAIYHKVRMQENISGEEVDAYFNANDVLKKEFGGRKDIRDHLFSTRIVNLLHKLFYAFFITGFVCLFIFLNLPAK